MLNFFLYPDPPLHVNQRNLFMRTERQMGTFKIADTPWHCAYFDDNLDDNWQAWLDLFFAAVDQCIPKRRHNNKFNPPWISRELLKLCGKKKLLFRKAKRVNTDLLGMRYRTLNNAVKKACNAAKGNYINDLAVELANNNNPKLFWSF